MTLGTEVVEWHLSRQSRSWSADEMASKMDLLPAKLEAIGGKVCLNVEQRLMLLAALLENLGTDVVVGLGDLQTWRASVDARQQAEAAARRNGEQVPDPFKLAQSGSVAFGADQRRRESTSTPERSWNYRAIRFSSGEDHWAALHEVHYEQGRPVAYSEQPAVVMWDPVEDGDLSGYLVLERMKEALFKPTLTESDFERSVEAGQEGGRALGPDPNR